MSKKFKSQASSARAASAVAFGSSSFGFGNASNAFQTAPSSLSYIAEFPDLSTVSDPNVVVSLRNLGKKDSTTKAKAIEDLQEYVNSAEAIEAGLLEAWISLYPRTSIDNSRRVRQLAHALQGSLTSISGKRIAPHLPKVIGSWLAGAYDSDKAVARAAQESIAASFSTEEKRRALWKVYKDALIQYAEDAILTQTPQTLSDERSTSPDDAEAKFVRVVGTAMLMLTQTIKMNYTGAATGTTPDELHELVLNKKLWDYAYHQDASLRRGTYSLVTICTDVFPTDLDWAAISAAFVGKALHSSQLGSSTQLSEALVTLTMAHPQIWTTDYSGKTAASKRLSKYLQSGSQYGSSAFWTNTAILLRQVPLQIWGSDSENGGINVGDVKTLLESLRSGVTHVDEPRQNQEAAWNVYVDIAYWIVDQLEDPTSKAVIFKDDLLPAVAQFITPDAQSASWTVPAPSAIKICGTILLAALERHFDSLFQESWEQISKSLTNCMRASLPESSKDFQKSQDAVIAQAQRRFRLRSFLLQSDRLTSNQRKQVDIILKDSDERLLISAIELLKARNGKPYGAGALLQGLTLQAEAAESHVLSEFLRTNALSLLDSPSAKYLIAVQLHRPEYLAKSVAALIHSPLSPYRASALAQLLGQSSKTDLEHYRELDRFVSQQVSDNLDNEHIQTIAKAILQNPELKDSNLSNGCFEQILNRLTPEAEPKTRDTTLAFLSRLLSASTFALPTLSDAIGNALLMKLLILSDSQDPSVSEQSNTLMAKLRSISAVGQSTHVISPNSLIVDQLSGKGTPLSIFALIDLGKEAIAKMTTDTSELSSLLPSTSQWSMALDPHICGPRDLSLVITSSLQGLVFMIDRSPHQHDILIRDADEFSLLFRLVFYVSKILSETKIMNQLSKDERNILYRNFPLALQLVNEKLTLESSNEIWLNTTPEVTDEAADVLSQGTSLLQGWVQHEEIIEVWSELIRSTIDLSPLSYFHGLTFTEVASRFIDVHGPTSLLASFEREVKDAYRRAEVIQSASLLSASREYLIGSQNGRRLLNELIAVSTEVKAAQYQTTAFRPLTLLNLLLAGSSEALETIPNQRVVFLMQSLARLLTDHKSTLAYKVEAMKLLDPVLSATKDIYGEHWDQILDYLITFWQSGIDLDNDLPLLHASLRLYGRLRTLSSSEEVNEDLSDAWKSKTNSLEDGLKICLESFTDPSLVVNQPRRITAELLRRQLAQISPLHDPNLYLLLSSAEDGVRGAAYDLLHRSIPKEQEQVSIDLALEQKIAQLPPDLIGLLTDVPNPSEVGPLRSRQSYLLSWHLVFDHFTAASYKLREAYSLDIKTHNILPDLLTYICETCRITSSKPLDASKFDIKTFKLGLSETDQKEEQWLVVHLYYCCLLYLPSLTRAWFIEQKNRIKSPLESWTQKYFASTLISSAIATVTEWVANQPQDDTEAPIVVKSSMNGSEAVASIAVDPESPPISLAISLPSNYPLDSPNVSSRTRVGVSEKNWQSWLRTFQIIIFSTGSIIEGLVAFRRNVQGALKGQSECAICYSIIGTDMQTPNKRCGTCRNTFHSVCLFRWFKSSNSSSCPLCRNNFNYA